MPVKAIRLDTSHHWPEYRDGKSVADIARLVSAGCIVISVVCACALAIQGIAFETFAPLNERHKH
jgi:hypothetical protein